MLLPTPQIRVNTDQWREIHLSPQWNALSDEWSIREDARMAYSKAFGLREQEDVILRCNDIDITHEKMTDSMHNNILIHGISVVRDDASFQYSMNNVIQNEAFRTTLFENKTILIVLMSIPPGGTVGAVNNTKPEIHPYSTQIITVYQGNIIVSLHRMGDNGILSQYERVVVTSDPPSSIVIKPGVYHFLENLGTETVKLHTTYSPPE
jgi:dTDP-4-dehydrorhamnose 3,5-epimerase-like enzyme